MFDIPKRFETNLEIKMKDFIPKTLNPDDKRRVKESIRSVRMTFQIVGEEIPSLVNEEYRCQVIQFYEIELEEIKDAAFLASLYQGIIKPLCVLRFFDSKEEVFSFALKRLNQTDESQIVVENAYLSQKYPYGLPGEGIKKYMDYLSYDNLKNKTDKLAFYIELKYKLFIIEHKGAFEESESILRSNAWYSVSHANTIYRRYLDLVRAREGAAKAKVNTEKVRANKEVKLAKEALAREIN